MNADMRMRSDEEHALRWLKRRLEWEDILTALRDAGQEGRTGPADIEQEPAAA
jgi:hypothetical protein